MIGNALLLAMREIRRNVMRAILTTLGIVIGVGAVITIVTIGNGASASVTNTISSLGRNLVILQPGARRGFGGGGASIRAPAFSVEDSEAIAREVAGLRAVAPVAIRTEVVVAEQPEPLRADHGHGQRLFRGARLGDRSGPHLHRSRGARRAHRVHHGRDGAQRAVRQPEPDRHQTSASAMRRARWWACSSPRASRPSARIRTIS